MITIIVFGSIFLILAVTAFRRPPMAFAMLLATFAFEQWAQSRVLLLAQYPYTINFAFGAIVILGLAGHAINPPRSRLVLGYLFWVAAALLGYAFFSVAWSPVQEVALVRWQDAGLYFLVTALLGPTLIRDQDDLNEMMKALRVFGGLVVMLLLFDTTWDNRHIRLESTGELLSVNPLATATFAGYVMLASLASRGERHRTISLLVRWLVIGACLAVAAQSGSRGQFFATIGIGVLVSVVSAGDRKVFRALAVVAIGGIAFWAQTYWLSESGERWQLEQMSEDLRGRLEIALLVLRAWSTDLSSIVFGLGSSAAFDTRLIGFYPHIVPLEVLAEEGLIGFGLLLLLLIGGLKRGLKLLSLTRSDVKQFADSLAILSMFVLDFLLSLKQGSLLTMTALPAFAIIIGRLTAQFSAQSETLSADDPATSPHRSMIAHSSTAAKPVQNTV